MLAFREAWLKTKTQQKPQPLKNKAKKAHQKQINKQKATQVWGISGEKHKTFSSL